MLLHPRTKEVKMISLSVCARHRADRFSEAAQCDLNIVDDFFNRDESQATASQATATQETNHGEEYSDDSGGN
jgi:hypothetical protein